MEKIYKVRVDGEFDFEFDSEALRTLDLEQLSPASYHILKDHQSLQADLVSHDFRKRTYSIRINGHTYEVEIGHELDLLIEKIGLSLSNEEKVNDIKAPMPGLILEVRVAEGQQVSAGDPLLVLEAMKMENSLVAPGEGVIRNIKVNTGQTVEKGQLLIELE